MRGRKKFIQTGAACYIQSTLFRSKRWYPSSSKGGGGGGGGGSPRNSGSGGSLPRTGLGASGPGSRLIFSFVSLLLFFVLSLPVRESSSGALPPVGLLICLLTRYHFLFLTLFPTTLPYHFSGHSSLLACTLD